MMPARRRTLEQVNRDLATRGGVYEVLEYAGWRGQSLVRHTPSGLEGQTWMGILLSGSHPSWSPECKQRQDLTAEDWSLRLAEAGMSYEVLEYAGCNGQSLARHTPSGAEGRTRLAHLLKGRHPSWSPECKRRNDLTAEDWSLRLAETGAPYEVLEYATTRGHSLVRHTPSGAEGQARVRDLLAGQHPSWSPESTHPANENPKTMLYLCETNGYAGKPGRFVTFGISRNTPKQRYKGRHIRTLKQSLRGLHRATMEKECLARMVRAFGPPDAGREAWLWDEDREAAALIIWDLVMNEGK